MSIKTFGSLDNCLNNRPDPIYNSALVSKSHVPCCQGLRSELSNVLVDGDPAERIPPRSLSLVWVIL